MLKEITLNMHLGGKIQLEHGKRDLATIMIYGSIGPMMDLVILKGFK